MQMELHSVLCTVLRAWAQISPPQPALGAVGQGPVVTFNLLRPDGSYVGYR